MHRFILLVGGLSLAACSPDGAGPSAPAKPEPAATSTGRMLGDEPATSPAAAEARATVDRYFKLLDVGNYDAAYKLWGNRGADTRGTFEQFKASFAPYSEYRQQVGEATAIKATNGKQYILVTAIADVKNRKTGNTAHREGTVMLSRSADPAEVDPDKKEWRIWGTDIRVQH